MSDEEMQPRDLAGIQPSVSDPKLFMVKCKIGKEQELVIRVLQKCVEMKKQTVFSAFTNGHSKGCFYMEAYRDVHVKEVIAGLRDVYQKEGCKLVPIHEMVLSLEANQIKEGPKVGDWIRIKGNVAKGLYKGDLGQVSPFPSTGFTTQFSSLFTLTNFHLVVKRRMILSSPCV